MFNCSKCHRYVFKFIDFLKKVAQSLTITDKRTILRAKDRYPDIMNVLICNLHLQIWLHSNYIVWPLD